MTKAERIWNGRSQRLSLWNRLFHGTPVSLAEVDAPVLCGDPASPDECAAYVTLRACVMLSNSARQAIRLALRVAILYWFSNVGERRGEGRRTLDPKRSAFHLAEAIGTGLTWDEAVAAMKRKPVDFSAYLRLLEIVRDEYARQWRLVYPDVAPAPIDVLAGDIGEDSFARAWESGARAVRRERHSGGEGHAESV